MFLRGSGPAEGRFESRRAPRSQLTESPSDAAFAFNLTGILGRFVDSATAKKCLEDGEALWKQLQSQASEFLAPPVKV